MVAKAKAVARRGAHIMTNPDDNNAKPAVSKTLTGGLWPAFIPFVGAMGLYFEVWWLALLGMLCLLILGSWTVVHHPDQNATLPAIYRAVFCWPIGAVTGAILGAYTGYDLFSRQHPELPSWFESIRHSGYDGTLTGLTIGFISGTVSFWLVGSWLPPAERMPNENLHELPKHELPEEVVISIDA